MTYASTGCILILHGALLLTGRGEKIPPAQEVMARRGEARYMGREMNIGGVLIGDGTPPFTIAEIGSNHMGKVELAAQLIHVAAEAGFSAVKFQKRENKSLYTKALYDAPYPPDRAFGPTYGLHREALEFGRGEYLRLQDEARKAGVILFSTPFDEPSAYFLRQLGVPAYKIASGALRDIPLIRVVASFGLPVIVSTGGGTLEDVRRVYDTIPWGEGQLAFLQCTASYPSGADQLNLRVIETLRAEFPDVVIGFSDHSPRPEIAVEAYGLGARIIEKHVTLDRTWKGTDHAFSLEPEEQRHFIENLARASVALGSAVKRPLDVEAAPIKKMARSAYAADDLSQGQTLAENNVVLKSPADGMAPWKVELFLGRKLKRDVSADEPLSSGDLE